MNIFKDLAEIRSGEKKARRDIAEAKKFLAEPWRWTCTSNNPFCRDNTFWNTLGQNVSDARPIEKAAYLRVRNEYMAATIQAYTDARTPANPVSAFTDGMKFVAIETDGNETEDEIMAKITRAVAEKEAFDALVSETPPDPDKPENQS